MWPVRSVVVMVAIKGWGGWAEWGQGRLGGQGKKKKLKIEVGKQAVQNF